MDPGHLILRVGFAYAFLLLLLRWSGHRTVAAASSQCFVLALVLGDLVDNVIWREVSILKFGVAAATLVGLQVGLAATGARFSRVQRWLEPPVRAVLRDGWPERHAQRRELLSDRELEEMLRQRTSIEPGGRTYRLRCSNATASSAFSCNHGRAGLASLTWIGSEPRRAEPARNRTRFEAGEDELMPFRARRWSSAASRVREPRNRRHRDCGMPGSARRCPSARPSCR